MDCGWLQTSQAVSFSASFCIEIPNPIYPWVKPNQCSGFMKIMKVLGCAVCKSWVLRSCDIKIRLLFTAVVSLYSRRCVHALKAQDISFDLLPILTAVQGQSCNFTRVLDCNKKVFVLVAPGCIQTSQDSRWRHGSFFNRWFCRGTTEYLHRHSKSILPCMGDIQVCHDELYNHYEAYIEIKEYEQNWSNIMDMTIIYHHIWSWSKVGKL